MRISNASRFLSAGLMLGLLGCSKGAGQGGAEAVPPPANATEAFERFSEAAQKLAAENKLSPDYVKSQMKEILKLDGGFVAANYNMAVLKGDQRAIEALAQSNPAFIPARENAMAYAHARGDAKISQLEAKYAAIAEAEPTNVTSRIALGRIALAKGAYKLALNLGRESLRREVDSLDAHRVVALALVRSGDTRTATLFIERALQRWKGDPELTVAAGELLVGEGKDSSALAVFQSVLKKEPSWDWVRVMAGSLALKHKDFGAAYGVLSPIKGSFRKQDEVRLMIGVAAAGVGKIDEALAMYDKVGKGLGAHVAWNRANALYRAGRLGDAAEAFKLAARTLPAQDKRRGEAATTAKEIAEYMKADEAQKREARIVAASDKVCDGADPSSVGNAADRFDGSWYVFRKAVAAFQGGNTDQIGGLVQCAFKIVPDSPKGKKEACAPMKAMWGYTLADALNQPGEAEKMAKEALACDPSNADAKQLQEYLKQKAAEAKPENAAAEG